jgi:hypothetical protein
MIELYRCDKLLALSDMLGTPSAERFVLSELRTELEEKSRADHRRVVRVQDRCDARRCRIGENRYTWP